MTPFLTNLLLFSPLLVLAALILYVLDRADHLRRGSGLLKDPEPTPELLAPAPEPEEEPPELVDPSDESDPGNLSDFDPDLDLDAGSGFGSGPELQTPPPTDTNPDPIPIGRVQLPAPAQPAPTTARARNVGAKKARSLARRDQRRAYHEFLISQQEERARAAAATAEDDEERIFAEKRRRACIEEEIAEKQKAERAARLEAERIAEEKRRGDVERLRAVVGGGEGRNAWRVAELAKGVGRGEEWVRGVLRTEGMLGMREGVWGMVTEKGWYVRVGQKEMALLYAELEKKGRMEWGEMAKVIEDAMRV